MKTNFKINNALKRQKARGVPEHALVELLQFYVTTMIEMK